MHKGTYSWISEHKRMQNFYKKLQKENEVLQLTVTNHSEQRRKVTMWGANRCAPIADPLYSTGFVSTEIDTEFKPNQVVYNPVTNLFYVTNFGSDTVSIIDTTGRLVKHLLLRLVPSLDPLGVFAMAVNTNPSSTEYGFVAVVCKVSNEIVMINTNHTLGRRIQVGTEPTDIIYNPFDDHYYVTNLGSGDISRFSTQDISIFYFKALPGAKKIGVNSDTGDIYVYESLNNTTLIYGVDRAQKGLIHNQSEVSFYYHSASQKMYYTAINFGLVYVVNGTTLRNEGRIRVGNNPTNIVYNPHDDLLYVANFSDQTFSRINTNNEVVDTIVLRDFTTSFAISSQANIFAFNAIDNDKLFLFSPGRKELVTIRERYEAVRQDFKYNPMLLKHLKIVASGSERINTLQLIEDSVTGMEQCESIALRNYHSPQGFGNISEVFEIKGHIIDGRVRWCFMINPNQQVTFLLYYKQLDMYSFLPQDEDRTTKELISS